MSTFTGQAIVAYSNKSEAATAYSKLPFETELGDMLEIDFFITKQERMKEYEMKNNPLR